MKSISKILIVIILLLSSYNFANEHSYIQPGDEYSNKKASSIYLVLELKPGEKFENSTNHTFKVINQIDFYKHNYQFELDSKIQNHEETLSSKEKNLGQVEKKIEEVRETKK